MVYSLYMADVDSGNHGGVILPGGDVVLAAIDDQAPGRVPGQRKTESDGHIAIDLLGYNHDATLLASANSGSGIVSLATSHLRSPHSKRAYRQAVMEFLDWCACTGTAEITKAIVHEYIGELTACASLRPR